MAHSKVTSTRVRLALAAALTLVGTLAFSSKSEAIVLAHDLVYTAFAVDGNARLFIKRPIVGEAPISLGRLGDFGTGGTLEPGDGPANERVAYIRADVAGDGELFVVNENGTGRVQITNQPNHSAQFPPSWGSDGRIAYQAVVLRNGVWEKEVWSVKPDGTDNRFLVRNASFPKYSPDGTKILYQWPNNGSTVYRIINSNGTSDRALNTVAGTTMSTASWRTNSVILQTRPHTTAANGTKLEIHEVSATSGAVISRVTSSTDERVRWDKCYPGTGVDGVYFARCGILGDGIWMTGGNNSYRQVVSGRVHWPAVGH